MKLLGLDMPRPSHRDALSAVGGALAVVVGFGIGSSLLGTPLDRAGAISLFIGCLYAFSINSLVTGRDAIIGQVLYFTKQAAQALSES